MQKIEIVIKQPDPGEARKAAEILLAILRDRPPTPPAAPAMAVRR